MSELEYKPIPNVVNVNDIQNIIETNKIIEQENIKLHSIIKEVREEIIKDREKQYSNLEKKAFYCNKTDKLLEILDKVEEKK